MDGVFLDSLQYGPEGVSYSTLAWNIIDRYQMRQQGRPLGLKRPKGFIWHVHCDRYVVPRGLPKLPQELADMVCSISLKHTMFIVRGKSRAHFERNSAAKG